MDDWNYLSVFNVLKSTRLTPLGIFKDFITSAGKEKRKRRKKEDWVNYVR